MSKIAGIDLGTTNSLVGVMDAGFPVLIADAEGRRLTPSVVHFPGPDQPPLAGAAAKRIRGLKPKETVSSIKRFMGRRGSEISREEMIVNYPIAGKGAEPVRVDLPGRAWSPEEISAEVLKKLKADAERSLGEPVTRAVITVPAYFNDAQRNATKEAGRLAGFEVERIVNEPTAAALAYGLDRLKEKAKIAVYDLGGGTFDISILELNEGVFQVLATNGNTRLGGDDIDAALTDELASRLARDLKTHVDTALLARLHDEAEAAKIRLSTEMETRVEIPFAGGERSFSTVVTREQLEALARPIVQKTRANCLRSLGDAKLKPAELDDVILVGGQTRMPLVRALVREIFGREPNTSANPDEAVALGATIQAGILEGGIRNMVLLDVTPLSLGIETFGGLMNVIIPRNTTIPTKAGELFTTAVDNQKSMKIQVLQGERELARDNWPLGVFELEFEPAPKGVPRVGVQFEIDANGILSVLARDVKTGHQKIVQLKSAVDVSDEAVEKMVAESVEYAFDDLAQRQWIETKRKSGDMLGATRKALAQVGHLIVPEEVKEIEALMLAVEKALESENLNELKAANAALDQGTVALADLVMDLALEERLRKKGALAEAPTPPIAPAGTEGSIPLKGEN
ncbi:MAG TPA: molecular chaperone DnaK [Candidatus Methylacidiphilales bacterium]|nr:molecular chaperone DnaK [Candidatus Methylacidiphilales bacterium]